MFLRILWRLLSAAFLAAPAYADSDRQAPRVLAALEQGRAAELGIGISKNPLLAMALYCDAGMLASGDGFFHLGRLLASAPPAARQPGLANTYLALAARLGRQDALKYYDARVDSALLDAPCGAFSAATKTAAFDLDAYLAHQSADKQKLAVLIRGLANEYGVDARLALAIALAESNLDANAVSPNKAQGVMQLDPETQRRFGVTRPFDAEQNVRGALAYLASLDKRFVGDRGLIVAAYHAADKESAELCGDASSCFETRQYVRHVLLFAGLASAAPAYRRRQTPALVPPAIPLPDLASEQAPFVAVSGTAPARVRPAKSLPGRRLPD